MKKNERGEEKKAAVHMHSVIRSPVVQNLAQHLVSNLARRQTIYHTHSPVGTLTRTPTNTPDVSRGLSDTQTPEHIPSSHNQYSRAN